MTREENLSTNKTRKSQKSPLVSKIISILTSKPKIINNSKVKFTNNLEAAKENENSSKNNNSLKNLINNEYNLPLFLVLEFRDIKQLEKVFRSYRIWKRMKNNIK